MTDLATLAVAIDATGSKSGADLAVASTERIKSATGTMNQVLSQTPTVLQNHAAAHRRLSQEMARTEAATRGLGSTTQQTADPFARLKQQIADGTSSYHRYAEAVRQAETETRKFGPSTTTAANGWTKLRGPLQGATLALAGLPGPAGRVIATLGSFAVGGGVMLAATAGVALFTTLLERQKERLEEQQKPMRDLLEKYEALAAARRKEEFGHRLAFANFTQGAKEARGEVENLLEELERVEAIARNTPASALNGGRGNLDGVIAALQERVAEAEARADRLERAAASARTEINADKDKPDDSAYRARVAQVAALADAEMAAQEAVARARGDITRAEALAHEQRMAAIERQVAGAERLDTAERNRLRSALQVVEAMERQTAEAKEQERRLAKVAEIYGSLLRNVPDLSGGQVGTAAQARRGAELIAQRTTLPRNEVFGGGANGIVATLLDRGDEAQRIAKELREARLREIDAISDTRDAAINLVASLGVVPDSFLALADGLNRVLTDVAKRADTLESGLTTANALDLASLGVGIIGGILQAHRQAEIEAAKFRAATADWERTLSRFAASIDGQSQLQKALQGLEDQFLQLAEQAAARNNVLVAGDPLGFTAETIAARMEQIDKALRDVGGGPGAAKRIEDLLKERRFLEDLARARELETKAIEAARKAFANQEYAYGQELEARLLSAQGRQAEAEALRLQERQRAELLEAQTTGYTDATLAALRHVHALEAEAAAREASIAALERSRESGAILHDLGARELELAGNSPAADRLRIVDQAIAEFERVQDLFRDGLIDEAALQRFNALIEGELNAGLATLEQQLLEAALAIEQFNQVSREDLEVRRLVALGLTEEAATRRLALEQERERLGFIAQGADAATLAFLDLVHGLERLDAETARLNAAERERLRLLEEERETQERLAKATEDRLRAERKLQQDLDVRFLEALGQADAADDLRRQVNNAREIEEAVTAGMSPALIAFLKQVQEAERVRDLADREARLASALEPDPVARRGSTTSFDGRSITSAQADTMAAYLATIAINTGQLVRLSGGQPTQTARGAVTASGGALGGATLNITVQQRAGETPGQALDRQLAAQGRIESAAAGTPPAV